MKAVHKEEYAENHDSTSGMLKQVEASVVDEKEVTKEKPVEPPVAKTGRLNTQYTDVDGVQT